MVNFFTDNEDIQFYLSDPRLKRIVELKERGYTENETYPFAPENFEAQVPYPIAIIKLEEGPQVTAQIVDCDLDEVKIGMKVESTFRRIQDDGYTGAIYYGYKFRKRH